MRKTKSLTSVILAVSRSNGKENRMDSQSRSFVSHKCFWLLAIVVFAVFAASAQATTYYQDYGSSVSESITVSAGTHHFQVNGIAQYMNTEWYLTYSGGSPVKTENSGFWATDPDYSRTFSSGTTIWIRAEVYDSDWNWKEAHRWNVTVERPRSGEIISASPSSFTGSARTVTVTVKNTGRDENNLIVEWDSKPSGWSVTPGSKQIKVPYNTTNSTYFTFTVTPPSSDSSGTIVWKLYYDNTWPASNTLLDTYNQSVSNTVPETISTPSTPSGPSDGETGQSLTYNTGGASSNKGHAVEYRFDWGDGTMSSWGSSTRSKTYSNPGSYNIRAQARCSTHTSVWSSWSSSKSVTIERPKSGEIISADPDTFTGSARTVTVTVKNTGRDDRNLIVECDSKPSGWSVSPGSKQIIVPYNTINSTYFTFTVTPPSSESSGTIVWKLYYDEPWTTNNTLLDTYNQSVSNTPLGSLLVRMYHVGGASEVTGPGTRIQLYDSGWNPIDDQQAPALWSDIPTGTYHVEAYYTGTFFGEEFWASSWGGDAPQVNPGQTTTYNLVRKYPYATQIKFYNNDTGEEFPQGDTVAKGTTVRIEVTVRNDVSENLNARVHLLIDRNQAATYDKDETSSPQTIGADGSTAKFVFYYTPDTEGTYYRALEVETYVNNKYARTDSWPWGDAFEYSPTSPDIRIEHLILDFESLVVATGGTVADSGKSTHNTTLVTGLVNESNDINSRYYYYYFDKKKPLILDVNQIALWSAEGLLQRRFERFGISDADLEPWPISGWTLARTPATLLSTQGVEGLVARMASDEAADFISPVFVGKDGGPIIIMSTLFVAFEEDVNATHAESILLESDASITIEPNYANIEGVYRISVMNRSGFKVLQIANTLAELPEVKFAEPDRIFTTTSLLIPNDTDFAQCWGIHNTGQSGGTVDMDMDGPEAWDLTTGDSSIIVVVIDNGVQQNHPDIQQIGGADFTGQGGGGGPFNACDNHGTAVAGCVTASINNSLGTVGIAPDCVVASARVMIANTNPCDGRNTTTLRWTADALNWANAIGARVSNNSNSYDTVSSLIDTAYANTRSDGMVHFASAGNDGVASIAYPASLPTVNAVAALDRDGDLATFSNHGSGLAFSAPGVSIYSTDRTGGDGYESGDYAWVNGTSFASPYTAGVAALVLSIRPTLDSVNVEQILQQSAVDMGASGYDTTFGWGFVNAFEAIRQASEAQDFTIYNDGSGTLTVSNITKESGSCWLSFSPSASFDIAPGGSQPVTVSVDATCVGPGIYSDRLLVYSNDPDKSPYPNGVYVNLTVRCVSTTIEQQPQDITICEGQDAVFDIIATGSEPLDYQWKKDSVDVGDSSTLILPSVQLEDNGSEIWCEVTNACGSVVVSTSAFLTVYPWPTVTINPNPDQLNAGWTLDGPNGYTYSNNGDKTISDLEFGSYTITWSTIPRWNTPLPDPDPKNLSVGNSINFIGNYQLIGDLNNDYSVDFEDLVILVNSWLATAPSIDMTGDDFINFSDFAVFGENWLWEL